MITFGACGGVGKRGRALGDKTVSGTSFSVASRLSMLALKESIMSTGSVTALVSCIIAYASFIRWRKCASSGASALSFQCGAILQVKSRDGSG